MRPEILLEDFRELPCNRFKTAACDRPHRRHGGPEKKNRSKGFA
jgi:hypothetical protein